MKRSLTLTFQYYRVLLLFNIAFTVLGIFLLLMSAMGAVSTDVIFCGKITGFCCAVALNYYSAKESYFYYRNAGYGMRQIIKYAFVVDIFVNLFIITLFILITNGLNAKG